MLLWGYAKRDWAERMWERWYGWANRPRLEPVQRVARMIRKHWEGALDAARINVTNALWEGSNSQIQWIKRKACGNRKRKRFRLAMAGAGYSGRISRESEMVRTDISVESAGLRVRKPCPDSRPTDFI